MRKLLIIASLALSLLFTSACVYRTGVIQGGQVDERAIKRVEVGMGADQVRRLLGTPMIQDIYHPDRWDYVYYTINLGSNKVQRVSIFFDKGIVSKIENTEAENKQPAS
ncbi:MAG: outer membrane protein assembly factor BamE [Gammaproteobacteria bacterium]|nr:outer membrane protein assembly factor BamE [Gammaproteobacteria bacterium]NNC98372.1 outer membrane protein assembly factor BamE [Gammaproteobacteria bacterium]NNM13299.1 outer membrane protein assembly factor BamE [Gammaproteobacteria bacterium]